MSTPLPVHEALGVRWGADPPVPRNYGDASAEYHAALERSAVVDRCDRALVRMHGRDPLRILQGIVTNDVAGAPPERAVYAALLTPKGRMVTDMRIVREGAEFLLDVPAAAASALLETFRRTVPPLFARYADVSAERHVVGVYGPEATSQLASVLGAALPPETEGAHVALEYGDAAAHLVGTGYAGVAGWDVIATRDAAAALWRALAEAGARPTGHAPLDVLRIEAGVPRWGAELTEETIPLEAGLAHAISTSKGCYTGQEVIIRILHRGHVNRHLRGVLLGEGASPVPGTALVQPETGKPVGRITSAAWSPRLDREIALAYVRREVEPPATLSLAEQGGAPVQVIALPFPL